MKTLSALLFAANFLILNPVTAQTLLQPLWTRPGLPVASSGVNFTPDGKYIVSGGYYEQSIRFWFAADGMPFWTVGGSQYSSTPSFSRDGNIMAVTDSYGSVTVVDITAKRKVFSQQAGAQYSALSADGKRIYILTSGKLLRVWDVFKGTINLEFPVNSDTYSAPVLSGDGKFVLIRGADRRVYVYDSESGAPVRSFLTGPYSISTLMSTPDGKYCLTTGSEQTIKVWKLDSGTLAAKFPASNYLTTLQFTVDGSVLAVSGYDSTATFYSTETWQKIRSQKFTVQTSFSLHPNSRQYLINEGDYVKFYEITTGKYLTGINTGKRVVYSRISPDGALLLTSAGDTAFQVRHLPEAEIRYQIFGHRSRIAALGFSADGKQLYSAESTGFMFVNNAATGTILGGRIFAARCNQPDATGDQTRTVALRGDSNIIFVGSGCYYRDQDNTLRYLQNINCYDIRTGEEKYAMDAETEPYSLTGGGTQPRYSPINRMMINSNGKYIAAMGNADATIGIWNTDLRELRKRVGTHDYGLRAYSFSDNGEFIITTSFQEVKLWDAPTGSLQNTITGMSDWVDAVAVSSNSNLIATQSGQEIVVWDAVSELPYRRFWLDTTVAGSLLFSPNNRYLVFCGRNIKVWHLATMQEIAVSPVFGLGTTSNLSPIQAAFSPDSRSLAIGSGDGGLAVFELGDAVLGAMRDKLQNEGFMIFPQPANALFSISFSQEISDTYSITVYDVLGKMVYSEADAPSPSDSIVRIKVNSLPPGTYICAVTISGSTFAIPCFVSR